MYRGFGLHLQIRASPKNKFKLRGVHLNPHAKCRSSRLNIKLFKKKKNGGHLNSGNTLVNIFKPLVASAPVRSKVGVLLVLIHYLLLLLLFVGVCV